MENLKKFIEWYKKTLEKDYNDKAKRMRKEIFAEDWWFLNGQCTAIQRLITLLDNDVEKFIEETINAKQ